MPEQAVSSPVADVSLATYPKLRRALQRPGPFAWRVAVPPTRDVHGKVIDIIAPLLVRGLTRHEAADNAARTLFASAQVPKRRVPKLPRGTQVTRVRLSEALVDLRTSRPGFSIRFS